MTRTLRLASALAVLVSLGVNTRVATAAELSPRTPGNGPLQTVNAPARFSATPVNVQASELVAPEAISDDCPYCQTPQQQFCYEVNVAIYNTSGDYYLAAQGLYDVVGGAAYGAFSDFMNELISGGGAFLGSVLEGLTMGAGIALTVWYLEFATTQIELYFLAFVSTVNGCTNG